MCCNLKWLIVLGETRAGVLGPGHESCTRTDLILYYACEPFNKFPGIHSYFYSSCLFLGEIKMTWQAQNPFLRFE